MKTNEEEGGDKSEEGGDENQEEGNDENEVEGEDEREKEADNSWNGTGEEETEKGLESCRKRTNELRKMAEDLDRDFEKVREKARQDRKEKENIYNAYQELLKRKEKDDRETEAKIRRLEEMNEEKDKKIEEKDKKLSADFLLNNVFQSILKGQILLQDEKGCKDHFPSNRISQVSEPTRSKTKNFTETRFRWQVSL